MIKCLLNRGMRMRESWALPVAQGWSIATLILLMLGLPGHSAAEHGGAFVRPVVDSVIGSYEAKTAMSGAIAIAGSDTMQPIMAKVASVFRQRQPDVKIAVQGGGSDAALTAFVQGIAASRRGDGNVKGHLGSNEITVLASSRPLTSKERDEFRARNGYEPAEIPIALDAVAIYVNRSNPIQGLTIEQLDAIFGRDRKRGLPEDIRTWGQLGLTDGWEQQPIRRYGRDKRSGTRTFFIHAALMDGEMKTEVKEEPGSAMEILDLSRDALGIGYAGIGFQASTVRILPLAEKTGMPYVPPNAETAADGTYPLARFLYLYVRKDPKSAWDPEVLEFLRFVNSREGQEAIVKAGVYPLPAPHVAKNLQLLNGAAATASALRNGSN